MERRHSSCAESHQVGKKISSPVTGDENLNICLQTFVIKLYPQPVQSGLQQYRLADKPLARPGREQANVSVRMA